LRSSILLGTLLLCALAGWPADRNQPLDIKPGLWEIASSIQYPQPALHQTSAENRDGSFPPGGSGGVIYPSNTHTFKACVTKEAFAPVLVQAIDGRLQAGCTQKVRSSSASKLHIQVDCDQGHAGKVAGTIVVKERNAEEIKGSGTMTFLSGHPFSNAWSITGRFVSADCGEVKPAASN
jgi:Protein of unknown function (DUF3617)